MAGAAAVFDELGLDRYAQIARSDTTREILDAWRDDMGLGHARFLAAHAASGVHAPDTAVLEWGGILGSDEMIARDSVERALEDAIVAGDLRPGARGWRQVAARVCEETLQAPLDDPGGQTLLTRIITERVDTWLNDARDPDHRRWRDRVTRHLLTPIPPPEDPEPVVAPLQWLLDQAVEGITLTQSNYLPRTLVIAAVERFGWWDWPRPPRSEANVPQLGDLRDAARSLRLVRRKGHRLLATTNGRKLCDDPEALWRALATTLGGSGDFGLALAELVGLRLLDGAAVDDELLMAVLPIVLDQGWRTPAGPVTEYAVHSGIYERLRWWRMLGLLEEERARWEHHRSLGPSTMRLTDVGTTTVLAYLRHRATRARHSVYPL